MTILVLIGIGFLLWYSVIARLIVLHPVKTIYYGVRDYSGSVVKTKI